MSFIFHEPQFFKTFSKFTNTKMASESQFLSFFCLFFSLYLKTHCYEYSNG